MRNLVSLGARTIPDHKIFLCGGVKYCKRTVGRYQSDSALGQFTMDMVQATGAEGVPTNTTSMSGAAMVGDARVDHEYGSAFHALLMVGTFVILFPLGVLWLRVFDKVLLHWLNQAFGVLLIIVGAGIGIYIGLMYNKVSLSKS